MLLQPPRPPPPPPGPLPAQRDATLQVPRLRRWRRGAVAANTPLPTPCRRWRRPRPRWRQTTACQRVENRRQSKVVRKARQQGRPRRKARLPSAMARVTQERQRRARSRSGLRRQLRRPLWRQRRPRLYLQHPPSQQSKRRLRLLRRRLLLCSPRRRLQTTAHACSKVMRCTALCQICVRRHRTRRGLKRPWRSRNRRCLLLQNKRRWMRCVRRRRFRSRALPPRHSVPSRRTQKRRLSRSSRSLWLRNQLRLKACRRRRCIRLPHPKSRTSRRRRLLPGRTRCRLCLAPRLPHSSPQSALRQR